MTPPLKTGILGAGRIASGFGSQHDAMPHSLAHAINLTEGLELGGFFDLDEESADRAEKKWNIAPSPRKLRSWLDFDWDVICIATPDDSHTTHLAMTLEVKPKAILVEKPLSTDFILSSRLLEDAPSLTTPFQVNFPRRWHPDLQKLATRIRQNEFGSLRRLHISCSGGILHNGSHAIDLLASWISPKILNSHQYHCQSATHGQLSFSPAGDPIEIIFSEAVQEDCYLWEITADFDLARVSIQDVPEILTISIIKEHPDYTGFNALIAEQQTNLELEPLLLYSVQNLVRLSRDEQLAQDQITMEITHYKLLASIFSAHLNHHHA